MNTNKNPAKLPKRLLAVDYSSMPIGASAWVVPWIIVVDEHRRMWFPTHHQYDVSQSSRGGTAQARVTRAGENEWHLFLSRECDYRWKPSPIGNRGYDPITHIREEV